MTVNLAIIYHSGYGHTEKIAEGVKNGAQEAGAGVSYIKIPKTGDITDNDWSSLHNAHVIIFGSPTYMGMVSGPFKMFADSTSKHWGELKWKDKLAGGFTNSHSFSGDKQSTLIYMTVLAAQHGMIWVPPGIMSGGEGTPHQRDPEAVNRLGSFLGVMAQSENDDPENTPPKGDIEFGHQYGARLVEAAKRWHNIE